MSKFFFLKKITCSLLVSLAIAQAQHTPEFACEETDRVEKEITTYISDKAKTANLTDAVLIQKEAESIFKSSLGVWKAFFENPDKKQDSRAKDINYITVKDVSFAVQSEYFKQIYTISVANRVPLLVETSKNIFEKRLKTRNWALPGSDAEKCLKLGHGSCGNQAAVALALLQLAGLRARSVQFYYSLNGGRYSHIVPEVYIDEDWRLIDTTYGAFWSDTQKKNSVNLASTKKILERKQIKCFWNTALLPYSALILRPDFPDPFSYLTSNASILRGGIGEIKISLLNNSGIEHFAHLPNYIGDNLPDKLLAGVKYRLKTKKNQKLKIQVVVKGFAFSEKKPLYIRVGNEKALYSEEKRIYDFLVKDPNILALESLTDVSYLVLDRLSWQYMSE